jgi:hypothetical protein
MGQGVEGEDYNCASLFFKDRFFFFFFNVSSWAGVLQVPFIDISAVSSDFRPLGDQRFHDAQQRLNHFDNRQNRSSYS